MRQIVFYSRATKRLSDVALATLWETADRRNREVGITGLMLCDGDRFMMAIEGDDAAVQTLMHRIRADPRHSHITIFSDRSVETRHFPSRTLGIVETDDTSSGKDFMARVMSELDNVEDPQLVAAFLGFARLSKRLSG